MTTTTQREKISKKTVDSASPRTTRYDLWDTDLHGFGVRILPSGRKTYFVQYRLGTGGSAQKFTIGPHGVLTADQARSEARRILAEVRLGLNPKGSATVADNRQPTVAESFSEYISIYGGANLKRRTLEEYSRAYRLHVVPRIGSMLIGSVNRTDIERLHVEVHRDAPVQANRTVAVVRGHFSWLELNGQIAPGTNPCRGVRKTKETPKERYLSESEIGRLIGALDRSVEDGLASPSATLAIRLLLFTGARKSEILTLRWEDVALSRREIRLRDSKTGPDTIRLNTEAFELLKSAERKVGNPFVCPGEREGHHLVNLQKPWTRILAAADLASVRLHDLRHTFASVAAAEGVSIPIIGGVLRHKSPQTTARYAHLSGRTLHAAAEQVGRAIMASVAKEPSFGGDCMASTTIEGGEA